MTNMPKAQRYTDVYPLNDSEKKGSMISGFDSKSVYLKKLTFLLDTILVMFIYEAVVAGYHWINPAFTVSDLTYHQGLVPVILGSFMLFRYLVADQVDVRQQNFRLQIRCIVQEMAMTVAGIVLLIFLLKLEGVSRIVVGSFFVASIVGLLAFRRFVVWWYITRLAQSRAHHLHVLVIGSGRRARLLADQMTSASEWGVDIIGFLDPTGQSAGRRETDEVIGHVDDISYVLQDNVVDEVIVALPRRYLDHVQTIINACQEEGVRLRFMADFYDFDAQRVQLSMVNGIPLLGFEPVAREEGKLLAKRIFDLAVVTAALPFLVPLFALIALCIKLDSKGPVFFVQERVGLNKRRFPMFKFRSMVPDAEARLKDIEHLNEADGPNFKIKHDPRITRLGSFLRKTSLDELPQLINVVRGEMSLVGPRPMSIRDVELFDKGIQRKRFSVRPGLTCIWQISGRSDVDFDQWLAFDLEYIDHWSFWLDIKILFKTIPVVLRGSGAS